MSSRLSLTAIASITFGLVMHARRMRRVLFPALFGLLMVLAPALARAQGGGAAKGAAPAGKKWFPGHYVMSQPDDYTATNKAWRVLKGENGDLFKGLFMYVTWGQIETTQGRYQWEKIDTLLKALPEGKKLAVSLSWQGWGGVEQAVPADMIDNPDYDGGQRVRGDKQAGGKTKKAGVRFATIHLPATMDRYLAFTKSFAQRYDADPRLAFVTSAEIPYEASLHVGKYDAKVARETMGRLSEMVGYFKQTPSGVLGAWWSFGGPKAEKDAFVQGILDAGGGFGFPDLDGTMAGGHYNSHFRPDVIAHAGKWPCWMGVEWQDLMPDRAGKTFPDGQIKSANLTKTNFIWWITSNRRKDGGYDFDTDVIKYLRAHPEAGITTKSPLGGK